VIVTEVDWPRASVTTKVDGTVRQNYPLSDMIMSPTEFDGATVEVTIDGIGSLTNALAPASGCGAAGA
jgi:2-keto-4-pentenoate hydratase/2-oxohepta-3-ene-1,7-dioic acid hydratase in catechol pathway